MKKLLLATIILFFAFSAHAATIYVDANGTGDYPTIQAAIDDANNGDEVVLMPGAYTGIGNYSIDFAGKAITVKGVTGNPDDCIILCNDPNTYRVKSGFRFTSGEDANSILEAVTITKAYSPQGGAIYCINSSPTIRNCVIRRNWAGDYGAGIYNKNSNPTIVDCTISDNRTAVGAGIYNNNSSPIINNCVISGNVTAYAGGGIFNTENSRPNINNCVISGNSVRDGPGGGIWNWHSNPRITNCTITNNSSSVGSTGIFTWSWNVDLRNSIIWNDSISGSRTVSFCNIQGGSVGIGGNINADPCFVDPCIGDYHLLSDSPCINAGDPNYIPEPNETDLDGRLRIIYDRIDMGAYEFQYKPIAIAGPNQIVYACIDELVDVNLDGSGSYDDDNDILDYYWSWTIDTNDCEANGIAPIITLPVGEHQIELIVDDGIDESEPDYCTVTVIEPLRAKLFFVPRVLNTQSRRRTIVALLAMPQGILRSDINQSELLVFTPGNVIAQRQYVFQWKKHGRPCTWVMAVFNKSDCMPHLSPGQNQVEVTGKLNDGRYFFGTDTIKIINPKNKPRPNANRYRCRRR